MALRLHRLLTLASALLLAVAGLTAGCDRDEATGKTSPLVHLPKKSTIVPMPNSGPTMNDLANADNPPTQAMVITDPRQLSGTYEGALPCPDCTAIMVRFTMLPDGSFQRIDRIIGGKNDGRSAASAGRWRLGGDGKTIEAGLERPESMVTFAIEGPQQLRMLDIYGRRIEGADSERYVLRRDGVAERARTGTRLVPES